MTINTQTRSVSVSHAPLSTNDQPRHSASISGASLLGAANHSSSFFSNESADHTTELEDSLEDAEQEEPLDIVGALNTLNLDAELGDNSPKKTDTDRDRIQTSSVPPPRLLSQNILTPNPPSVAAFGGAGGIPNTLGNPASTPSYGWNNKFLPFSAPPMAYPISDPAMMAEMAMQIPPFRLPEEHMGMGSPIQLQGPNGNKNNNNTNNNVSHPHPGGGHNFGGILDSRFAFDGLRASSPDGFGTPQNYRNGDGSSENPAAKNFENAEEISANGQFVGSNLWNTPQHPMPPFDTYLGNQFNHFGQMNMLASPQTPVAGQLSSPVYAETANGYGGPRLNQGEGQQQFNGNRRHNNHHNHMNGGVNIHRKMHNSNRRKGDDASKYANAKLEDFKGDIFSLCKDQHGCRFLQRQLDNSTGDALSKDVAATMIFNELYLKIVELMVDPFGNYLIQKLLESVSPEQRLILVKNAAPDFVRIALDPHGTRALQKLVECISTPEESCLVIESLSAHIVSLSRDLNGNHVVQKCLQRLKPEENQFIFDTASVHCGQIATHRHGCCVLQRCLDHGNAQQREQLSSKVAEIATNLSLDPFGNYVVQYVLTRGDQKSISMILAHVRSNIVSLSLHKFGSNVIEKSLRISHLTDTVIGELLYNHKQFPVMLNDPFGNYVLQTSLDVASASDLAKLASALQPFLPNIKNTPHGRRILTKIQNIL